MEIKNIAFIYSVCGSLGAVTSVGFDEVVKEVEVEATSSRLRS